MNRRENRRSFRIKETVYVQHEVISESEFAGGPERRRLKRGDSQGLRSRLIDIDARLDEKLFLLKTSSEQVANCLALLNQKIDLAINALPAVVEQKATLASEAPRLCELSADGMVFGAADPYAPETKLSLRLLLETDSRYVETFCRVVRLADPPDPDDQARPYGIAVEFVGMAPAQKEILIQHLFSRESETLRIRRLKLDA